MGSQPQTRSAAKPSRKISLLEPTHKPQEVKMNVVVRAPTLIFRLFFILFFSLITLNLFYFMYFFSRKCL